MLRHGPRRQHLRRTTLPGESLSGQCSWEDMSKRFRRLQVLCLIIRKRCGLLAVCIAPTKLPFCAKPHAVWICRDVAAMTRNSLKLLLSFAATLVFGVATACAQVSI